MKKWITYFFGFRGRRGRLQWWNSLINMIFPALFVFAVMIAFSSVGIIPPTWGQSIIDGFTTVFYTFAYVATSARRLHDRNKSASWLVLFWALPSALYVISSVLIGDLPFYEAAVAGTNALSIGAICQSMMIALGIWAFVELGCRRGTAGSNRFGPDPLPHMSAAINGASGGDRSPDGNHFRGSSRSMEPLLKLAFGVTNFASAALAGPIMVIAALGYISWWWLAINFLPPMWAGSLYGIFFGSSWYQQALAWAMNVASWFALWYLWPHALG